MECDGHLDPPSEAGTDEYRVDTERNRAAAEGSRAGAEGDHLPATGTDEYRGGTEGNPPKKGTQPAGSDDAPPRAKDRRWWEAEGFATEEEAVDDLFLSWDRDERRRRRESGEELVGARLPENERPLPDPRYGRTLGRRYQVNFKLNYNEWSELKWLARECTLPLGTLARMLVLRGTRASRQAFAENDRAAELDP